MRDQAIGEAPQHRAVGAEQIERGHVAPAFEVEHLPAAGIGQMCKRRPKNIADLCIGRERHALVDGIRKTGHLDGQGRARHIVQPAEVLRAMQLETEFLAGLALCRVFEVAVTGFGCAAGKGNVARPRIGRMRGALDEEEIEIIRARVENRNDSRLRFIRFRTKPGSVRR